MSAAILDERGTFLIEDKRTNFNAREFVCKCGRCEFSEWQSVKVDADLIEALQRLRDVIDNPITVTSGIRCAQHNANVGGASHSKHVPGNDGIGIAADVMSRGILPAVLYIEHRGLEDGGGVGLYRDWVHIDMRASRMEWLARGAHVSAQPFAIRDYLARLAARNLERV